MDEIIRENAAFEHENKVGAADFRVGNGSDLVLLNEMRKQEKEEKMDRNSMI